MSDTKLDDVIVTRAVLGLVHMQVCAQKDVPHETVQSRANALNPAGTENGWRLITENTAEGDDAPNGPVTCSDDPDRLHYLLVC